MSKVAIIVLSYRMPEMTDALVRRIEQVTRYPHDLFVIDNGSPDGERAFTTTHRLLKNDRLTGGFNYGINCVLDAEEANGDEYEAIWFVCNDVRIRRNEDVLAACMARVSMGKAAGFPVGIIHPSMEPDPKTFNHPDMIYRGNSVGVRETDWVDIICPIYTRDAMRAIGWQFNPKLVYGWGIDRETSYLCWTNDLRVLVCDEAQVWHNMGTTYAAGKDTEFKDFNAYKAAAGGAQWPVLAALYGDYERVFAEARPLYRARRSRKP